VNAIVGAAARVLARRGYAGTTTNHVAARAGVSVGSLYEYFRDKDAVVRAVMDRHLEGGEALFAARAHALAPRAATTPLKELLREIVKASVDFHADDPRLHRVLSSEVPRTAATTRRVLDLEAKIVDVLAALLAGHPESKARAPRLAAQVCVQTIDALVHRWIVDDKGGLLHSEELTFELVELLFAYVAGEGVGRGR
jgi:AcrR family transcriptional regulator